MINSKRLCSIILTIFFDRNIPISKHKNHLKNCARKQKITLFSIHLHFSTDVSQLFRIYFFLLPCFMVQKEKDCTTSPIVITSTPKTPPPKPRRFQAAIKHRSKDPVCHLEKKHETSSQSVQLRPRKPNNQQLSASQLTINRKSLSESDLLHEIDKSLVLAKGFLFARGRIKCLLALINFFSVSRLVFLSACNLLNSFAHPSTISYIVSPVKSHFISFKLIHIVPVDIFAKRIPPRLSTSASMLPYKDFGRITREIKWSTPNLF